MIMIRTLLTILAISLTLVGCASSPTPRPMYTSDVPPLGSGLSRLKITSGKFSFARLWTTEQLGPVFINDQPVWDAAKDEYVIIDLLPGNYELSWTPRASDKVYTEKRQFTFRAGETRHFACDQAQKGAGMYFGLVGALASEYLTKTYLEERPMDNPNSTLVAYKVFNETQNLPESVTKTIEKNTQPSTLKTEAPPPSIDDSTVYVKLEKLKKMYESNLITKEEYDSKRKELVNEF